VLKFRHAQIFPAGHGYFLYFSAPGGKEFFGAKASFFEEICCDNISLISAASSASFPSRHGQGQESFREKYGRSRQKISRLPLPWAEVSLPCFVMTFSQQISRRAPGFPDLLMVTGLMSL
jgi:hypothetical protein